MGFWSSNYSMLLKPFYWVLVHFIWNQSKIREFSMGQYGALNGSIFTFNRAGDLTFRIVTFLQLLCTLYEVVWVVWFWGAVLWRCWVRSRDGRLYFFTSELFGTLNDWPVYQYQRRLLPHLPSPDHTLSPLRVLNIRHFSCKRVFSIRHTDLLGPLRGRKKLEPPLF